MPPTRASESDAPVKAWRTENSDGDRHPRAGLALLGLAVALRYVEYLHNKAIWLDEAHLALNILKRDYAGLTERLDAVEQVVIDRMVDADLRSECAKDGIQLVEHDIAASIMREVHRVLCPGSAFVLTTPAGFWHGFHW